MMSARQRLLALALGTIGALAWWQTQHDQPSDSDKGNKERRPSYTVNNFTVTMMDELGKPYRRLTAVELRHYPDDDSNELESPRLTLFEDAAPPWLVRSEKARLWQGNDRILLQGKVKVDRERGERTRPVHLRTPELLLKRDKNYAETDQPVRITSDSDWTTADTGARVWLDEKVRIKLLGRVHGEMAIP